MITFFKDVFLLTVVCENAGWKEYLSDNPTEFHDIPLKWQNGSKVKLIRKDSKKSNQTNFTLHFPAIDYLTI